MNQYFSYKYLKHSWYLVKMHKIKKDYKIQIKKNITLASLNSL